MLEYMMEFMYKGLDRRHLYTCSMLFGRADRLHVHHIQVVALIQRVQMLT